MVIVAGHVTVEPQERESDIAGCVRVVEQGRAAVGCLDLAVTADLIDPGRVNVYERWESQEALEAYRTIRPRHRAGRDDALGVGPSMLMLRPGAGVAFSPVLLDATGDVEPHESGLALGVLNTAFMITDGADLVTARNGDLHSTFPVATLAALAAASSGGALLRSEPATGT